MKDGKSLPNIVEDAAHKSTDFAKAASNVVAHSKATTNRSSKRSGDDNGSSWDLARIGRRARVPCCVMLVRVGNLCGSTFVRVWKRQKEIGGNCTQHLQGCDISEVKRCSVGTCHILWLFGICWMRRWWLHCYVVPNDLVILYPSYMLAYLLLFKLLSFCLVSSALSAGFSLVPDMFLRC